MVDVLEENGAVKMVVPRPLLLVDDKVLMDYCAPIRRIMSGLIGQVQTIGLVAPPEADIEPVVSPIVELFSYPYFRPRLLYKQSRQILLEKIEKYKFSHIHCFTPVKLGLANYISRELNLPYVMTFTSTPHIQEIMRLSQSHCCGIIATTEGIRQTLLKSASGFTDRIFNMNIGTFIEDKPSCFSSEVRSASVVVCQDLLHFSDYSALLPALRHLAVDGYEFVVVIIGSGRAEKAIREEIRKHGLSQMVTIVPVIRPIRTVFNGADIFLMTSSEGNFSINILEAMGAGMVVAAGRNCKDDMLIENQTAVLFNPHDERDIYTCLVRLLDGREDARKIASAGQELVGQKHSVSQMIEDLLQVYRHSVETFNPKTTK